MNKLKVVKDWVARMNQIPGEMLMSLMSNGNGSWSEVTTPAIGSKVYLKNVPENDKMYGEAVYGEVVSVHFDDSVSIYSVKLKDDSVRQKTLSELIVPHSDRIPELVNAWSFNDFIDVMWVDDFDGVEALSACGFRVFYNVKWGHYFGLEDDGLDQYKEHWVPLFKQKMDSLVSAVNKEGKQSMIVKAI